MATRAFLAGCGNIGALYDLGDERRVWTHAKAYSLVPNLQLTVMDKNPELSARIAIEYGAKAIPYNDEPDLQGYDVVSIAVPTGGHGRLIEVAVAGSVPLVICEKPITLSRAELGKLVRLHDTSNTKIFVNYIRRFQPGFAGLREYITQHSLRDICDGINIKYCRGFVNNASHAFDLIGYLLDKEVEFNQFCSQRTTYESFPDDPTITGSFSYGGIPVTLNGMTRGFPVFEIELFFPELKIVICHSGDEVRIYRNESGKVTEDAGRRMTGILPNYMTAVIDTAFNAVKHNNEDNFAASARLNLRMLEVLDKINK